jgi:hypothetical protein
MGTITLWGHFSHNYWDEKFVFCEKLKIVRILKDESEGIVFNFCKICKKII